MSSGQQRVALSNIVTLNPCPDLKNDNFTVQSRCSNITVRDIKAMNWIRVTVALAEFLVVAILLAYVLIRREYKSILERLFIYLLLATLAREAVLMSDVEHQFEYKQMDQVCSVLGALDLYTAVLVIVILASTIIYLLKRVVYRKSNSAAFAKAFELGFVILTFLVPLIISVGLLYTDFFGLSTAWCWMREYDDHCRKTSPVKKILADSVLVMTGILCIILSAAIATTYWKIARQIKQAIHLMRQAVILLTCLIVNVAILVFSSTVINLTTFKEKFIILYIYTLAISIYDIIYPLGFLLSLKCQAVVSARKRRSTYTPLPKSMLNATAPESDRISANSNTVSILPQFTGGFTHIEPSTA